MFVNCCVSEFLQITLHLFNWHFYTKWLPISTFNNVDTTPKLQESWKYINFFKWAEVLQVLHLETIRDRRFSFNMQSEQMCFQSVMLDVKSFCCPDISVELVPPLWSQDSKQFGCWWVDPLQSVLVDLVYHQIYRTFTLLYWVWCLAAGSTFTSLVINMWFTSGSVETLKL